MLVFLMVFQQLFNQIEEFMLAFLLILELVEVTHEENKGAIGEAS